MPLFNNSSSNIDPEVDSEIPIDELPKIDGRRRLSFKKSFFVWSTQKQILDKNKFIFDSNSMIHSGKGKESRHDSYIIKSKKYSNGSINYDESDNDYSSESDINENEENEKKDFYSMEDLDNITALKKKYPKIRNVPPLSESTLCYSSNTNTINTISLEFNQKSRLISNNDVNYGFSDNQNNEGVSNINKEDINYGENSGENNGNKSNDESNSEINDIENKIENNEENKLENNEENKLENNEENKLENNGESNIENNQENNIENDIEKNIENNKENSGEDSNEDSDEDHIGYNESSDQSNNIEDVNIDNIDKIYNFDDEIYYESDIEENEEKVNENKVNLPLSKNKKRESKKTVTFSDNIVIIESLKPQKARNIFKRAISKIIKKKNDTTK